ncbi:MAG: pyridoxal phosphate-dependent aminotransferase [Planctomycetes bacterium]|nr:pyridoxal phosphate-dependent aminotransferase [Planctomycetota bacterium]
MTAPLLFHDPYIEWVQQQRAEWFDHDLGASGLVLAWDWAAWGVDLAAAPADAPNGCGYEPLRCRIAARLGVRPEQVLLAPGCTGANALVLAALVRRGDRVAVETPVYSPPVSVARGLGAKLVRLPRRADDGWRLDLANRDAFMRRLEGCALLFITNPHNPTGQVLDAADLTRIASACAAAGTVLVVDEIYREFPGAAGVPSAVGLGERVLVTSSVTKAYGLGGLRVGWIAGPVDLVDRCAAANQALLGRGSVVGEWLVDQLMEREDRWRALRETIAGRVEAGRAAADAFVRRRGELDWVRTEAGVCGLVKLPAGMSGHVLAARARERGRVFLVPGEFFGAPGYVRLSFGAGPARVAAGLAALDAVLDAGTAMR